MTKESQLKARIDKAVSVMTRPVREWPYPKVVVSIPLERTLSYAPEVLPSLVNIGQKGASVIWHPYAAVEVVRTHAVIRFLSDSRGWTHLLFLDSDHKHPADIIERLCKWVFTEDEEPLIVSGCNFMRNPPYQPCWYLKNKDSKDLLEVPVKIPQGLIRGVGGVGGGCLLISRKVFEKVPPPWFIKDYSEVMNDTWIGEDQYFSRKMLEYGVWRGDVR